MHNQYTNLIVDLVRPGQRQIFLQSIKPSMPTAAVLPESRATGGLAGAPSWVKLELRDEYKGRSHHQ